MAIKKHLLIISFFLFLFGNVLAQTYNPSLLKNDQIYGSDTGKLWLEIDNINYIKNNEFFSPIADGYTLLGTYFAPTIVYFPGKKIKLSAGGSLLSYYGREDKMEASLLFSFQYQLHPRLNLILGNIYGTLNHQLIEPLFDFERYLNNHSENGIQFIWNSKRLYADLWLDWEQQIFQGDPFQEKFNVGLSSHLVLWEREQDFTLHVPFQSLIRHEGGQVNSNKNEPLTTIFNYAIGLGFQKKTNTRLLKEVSISSYYVNYQDLSPTKRKTFIDGKGFYQTLEFFNPYFDFLLGYWYAEQYIAPIGNPLYESYSRSRFYIELPVRQMLTGKLNFGKEVYKGMYLGGRIETFYFIDSQNLDYAWTILVSFNDKFFIHMF